MLKLFSFYFSLIKLCQGFIKEEKKFAFFVWLIQKWCAGSIHKAIFIFYTLQCCQILTLNILLSIYLLKKVLIYHRKALKYNFNQQQQQINKIVLIQLATCV